MSAFQIFTLPSQQALDSSARALSGAKLYFFLTGTSTPTDAYSDSSLATPIANPLTADSGGTFAQFFLDPDVTYRIVKKSSAGVTLQTWDPANEDVLSSDRIAANLDSLVRTSAEISAGVTPVNYAYPPGDLRRYGCTTDGTGDNSAAIASAFAVAVASGGTGRVYHPGGQVQFASTIAVPAGITIYGDDRTACVFLYTGTGSAFKFTQAPNSSGYGRVTFRDVGIHGNDSTNVGAGVALNAGGYAYFEIDRCRILGFKYNIVLDQAEIVHIHHCLIESNISGARLIWLVNGDEWRGPGGLFPDTGSTHVNTGFTNLITINDNQLSGGLWGIVDDGGNGHSIHGNNFNESDTLARFAACTGLCLWGNSFETSKQTASANVLFSNASLSGITVGACTGCYIQGNGFYGDMNSGSCVVFAGSMHTGFQIVGNTFGSLFGRGAAIDVTKLGNSFVGFNHDDGSGSMFHYTGVHNDSDGNILLPPQNGAAPVLNVSAYTYGDTRYPADFIGGIAVGGGGATYTKLLKGSTTFDWPSVADGGTSSTTVTVTGVAAGDLCEASMTTVTPTGVWLVANYESSNTVRVTLHNESGSAVDLASGTLLVIAKRIT